MPDDKFCIENLAFEEKFYSIKDELIFKMEEELKKQADPRMIGDGDIFHSYYFTSNKYRNLYSRMVNEGEKIVPVWINASDIETDLMGE